MPRIRRNNIFQTNESSGWQEAKRKHEENVSSYIREVGLYNIWKSEFAYNLFDLIMIKRR